MKKILGILFLSLGLAAGVVEASPQAPVAGTDYQILKAPQPVGVPAGKIEVTEFFWYGCPHCAAFEPYLEAWVKKQGSDVVFKRVPVAFRDDFIVHSKMYHALDEMGVAEQLTPKIFNEINVQKDYLLTPSAQASFLAKNGVDKQKYLDAYNSFSTNAAVNKDKAMLDKYQVEGTPTLAVQGKYTLSPQTENLNDVISVLDFLVSQVRAGKM